MITLTLSMIAAMFLRRLYQEFAFEFLKFQPRNRTSVDMNDFGLFLESSSLVHEEIQ